MNSFFDKIYMTLANLPYIKRYHISEEWSEELELLMDRAGIGDVEYRPPTSCDSTIIYINGIQIWIGQVFYMKKKAQEMMAVLILGISARS